MFDLFKLEKENALLKEFLHCCNDCVMAQGDVGIPYFLHGLLDSTEREKFSQLIAELEMKFQHQ